jgi:hypothetical protein
MSYHHTDSLGILRPRWFQLAGAIIALGIALAACGQNTTSEGPTVSAPTATEDVFKDSTGFRPPPAFERRRIPDTPGPRRELRLQPTPTPTPVPIPISIPISIHDAPGSPLGHVPVPWAAKLDCEYLRQNQGAEDVQTWTKQGKPGKVNDVLEGTEGNDVIDGGDGDDVINGLGGNDIICGGPGSDIIYGEDGDDALFGEAGQDILYGGDGDDTLLGGPGSDRVPDWEGSAGGVLKGLDGGPGEDWLHGGDGIDRLEGGPGEDTLYGGMGNDDLYGENFVDTEVQSCPGAEPCADWLFGGFGHDQLFGGPGNDSINGDIRPPHMMNDTGPYTPFPPDWIKYLDLYEGSKQIQKGEPLPAYGNDEIRGNHGDDWLFDPGSDVEEFLTNDIAGQEGDDILIGGEHRDIMWGGIGDDKLWGRDGHDNLTGGVQGNPDAGNDALYGGAGPDELSSAEVKIGGPGDDKCMGDNKVPLDCDDDP